MYIKIYCLVITLFYSTIITGQPIENTTSILPPPERLSSTIGNDTAEELIVQQTESVKKIVAEHNQQQASTIDYPVVTKLEPDYSEEAKRQIEKLSIEQLKTKCQHLSKLFQLNKTNTANKPIQNRLNSNQNTLTRTNNHKPYISQTRPIYVPPKPTFKPKYFTTQKPNGFYITQSTVTQKPPTNTQSTPIKYIRLEPVILQKTILSDGRTVYYWHRSLPTAVEIASDTVENQYSSTVKDQRHTSFNHDYYSQFPLYSSFNNNPYFSDGVPHTYGSWLQDPYATGPYLPINQNSYTEVEEQKSTATVSEPSTTSTTEQSSYSFGSFLPFYSYRQEVSTTTTTEPSTTTTNAPTTQKLKTDDLLYAQQLKFIIPVPYDNMNGGMPVPQNPWDFDQFAYYPKELQPTTMNVQVPYTPTFHMIRAVAVPTSVSKSTDETAS